MTYFIPFILAIFVLLGSLLLIEIGFTTEKNITSNSIGKLVLFAVAVLAFAILGASLYGGADIAGILGRFNPLLFMSEQSDLTLFMYLFLAAVATSIAAGAFSERTKLTVYIVFAVLFAGIIFPVLAHSLSTTGWLTKLGYYDGAGISLLHISSGVAAFIGAYTIGPRLGKYMNHKVYALPSSALNKAALGSFLAWGAWIVIDLLYPTDLTSVSLSVTIVNLLFAPSAAILTSMLVSKVLYRSADASMVINSVLAGLVCISAGYAVVTPLVAIVYGVVAGGLCVLSLAFIDKVMHIDDPLGVSTTHGVMGVVGVLLTGLFAQEKGLFMGGGISFFSSQLLGVVAIVLVVAGLVGLVLKIVDLSIGVRISSEVESIGRDGAEFNVASSFDGLSTVTYGKKPVMEAVDTQEIDIARDLSNERYERTKSAFRDLDEPILRRFEIITNPNRLERLTQELNEVGVTGMNVTSITGFGVQRGNTTQYRGVEVQTNFLPKIKLETIVSTVKTEDLLEAVKKALYTGHIGDGKIFISEVLHVVRVSTGESDQKALLYPEEKD